MSDARPEDDRFEELMRGLQFGLSADRELSNQAAGFRHVRMLIARAGGEIEDLRPWQGIIETKAALYHVVEVGNYPETLIGDVAVSSSEAFGKSKNFVVYAPELPSELEHRIVALGQANYFRVANLVANLCTSEMQLSRTVSQREHTAMQTPSNKWGDSVYWVAAAKTFFWIIICIAIYEVTRNQLPNPFVAPLAALAFWFKAFYGTRPLTNTLSDPRTRIIAANNTVTPIFLVAIVVSLAVLPNAIPILTAIAISIDIACFTSLPITRFLVKQARYLPQFLR